MPFELFKDDPRDPPKRKIEFKELDNKAFWCKLGEQKEVAFVQAAQKMQTGYIIHIHPAKANNSYHPDLLCIDAQGHEFIGEVKIKNSPLFMAQQYNISPQFALTMDMKDSFNYTNLLKQGIDLILFIWVRWEAHEMRTPTRVYRVRPMRGLWKTKFSQLRQHEIDHPPPIHWYKEPFRQAPMSEPDHPWAQQLLAFEPRLQRQQQVQNISSNGHTLQHETYYPAGQSSASYVFDLNNHAVFDRVVFCWDDT